MSTNINQMSTKKSLKLIMQLAKLNAMVNRRFYTQGLGLAEFMVLFYLNEAPGGKLRRVDLAEQLGLTASGITRLLLPMEKIGLVKRDADKNDARVSYAAIAPGGKRTLEESMEKAELLSEEILFSSHSDNLEEISSLFKGAK
jgi:DNA-binding MarR family transcriptional regulator